MNFENRTLVQFADPDTRAGLFDQTSLRQLLTATYVLDPTVFAGPFAAAFDEVRLGLDPVPKTRIEGRWSSLTGPDVSEAALDLLGIGRPIAIDGHWRGRITATADAGGDRIEAVSAAAPTLADVDARVAATNGGLPADPAALETERRLAMRELLTGPAASLDGLPEAAVDTLLTRRGVESVGALLSGSGAPPIGLAVRSSEGEVGAPAIRALPFAGILLIGGADVSLLDLLRRGRMAVERLSYLALSATEAAPPLRHPLVAVWMLPLSVFEDDDWPGADAAARRSNAGDWLAEQGIGLVAVPEAP